MVGKEQDGRTPYRQFVVGDNLGFVLNTLCPDGSIATRPIEARIEAVTGGGISGQALLLQDFPFVLKTGITTPFRDFWRRLKSGAKDIPYQVSELDAKLGSIKIGLIHDVVSPITKGKLYAPKSFGYTELPGTFAQAVERLYGRPPRYDNHKNEFRLFKEAQIKLTGIAYRLGLEHDHFAMANLRFNPSLKRIEWSGTLPAIPRIGFNERELFDDITLKRIKDKIALYQQLMSERNKLVSSRNYTGLVNAGRETVVDLGRGLATKTKSVLRSPIELITNPPSVDKVVLSGVETAFDTGTITKEELQEARSVMQAVSQQEKGRSRFLNKAKGGLLWSILYGYYNVSGQILNVSELATYAWLAQEDWSQKGAAIIGTFLGFRAVGGLHNYFATRIAGLLTKRDLDVAAKVSALPIIGIHLAIPAQIGIDGGSKSRAIWHYTVRNIIAGISKISPSGGWGSQLEGRLWGLFGKRLEGLAKLHDN